MNYISWSRASDSTSELYPDPLSVSESASADSELELMLDTEDCPSVINEESLTLNARLVRPRLNPSPTYNCRPQIYSCRYNFTTEKLKRSKT